MPNVTDTIHATEAEQEKEGCLLKIMSSPELLLSLAKCLWFLSYFSCDIRPGLG